MYTTSLCVLRYREQKKDMCALKKKSGFRGAISRHDDRYLFIFNKDFFFFLLLIYDYAYSIFRKSK